MLQIPKEGKNTANFLFFGNKLTDAFNGKVKHDPHSEYRTLLTDSSFHLQFFDEAYQEISLMRFVDPKTKKPVNRQPPTLKNFKLTLRGFKFLWKRLKDLGFESLKTAFVNQDPLENFFSQIRDCGVNNRKPTCYQFVSFFKTLVINNMTYSHSMGANCMDDEGSFIQTWQSYFDFEESDQNTVQHTRPACFLPSKVPKIRPSQEDPIPEKGSI